MADPFRSSIKQAIIWFRKAPRCPVRDNVPETTLAHVYMHGNLFRAYQGKGEICLHSRGFKSPGATTHVLSQEACKHAADELARFQNGECKGCKHAMLREGLGCYGMIFGPILKNIEALLVTIIQQVAVELGPQGTSAQPSLMRLHEKSMHGFSIFTLFRGDRGLFEHDESDGFLLSAGSFSFRVHVDAFWNMILVPNETPLAQLGTWIDISRENLRMNADLSRFVIMRFGQVFREKMKNPLWQSSFEANQFSRIMQLLGYMIEADTGNMPFSTCPFADQLFPS
ncbi:MAG: hypothetical protein Q6373_021980 [Candidatus Sigynarchaeota archaeon]